MSKRFTDTELWDKPWYMELTPAEKLAWFYIKDRCDNVGVWTPNFRLAEFVIGSQLDWEKFAAKCHGNVRILENGKWWLVDFCAYQHPDFVANPDGGNSNALKSYVRELTRHGLYADFLASCSCPSDALRMPLPGPSDGPKARLGKGKGKEKSDFSEIDSVLDHLNSATGKKYRKIESNRVHVRARLEEGATVEDCKRVIDVKAGEWVGTEFEKYLNPETLFRPSKFDKYLNQNGGGRDEDDGLRPFVPEVTDES